MRQPESLEASRERMRTCNPAVIARNHLVEEALKAAVARHDLKPMDRLLEVLAHPYQDPPQNAGYHRPPPLSPEPYRTFCGT